MEQPKRIPPPRPSQKSKACAKLKLQELRVAAVLAPPPPIHGIATGTVAARKEQLSAAEQLDAVRARAVEAMQVGNVAIMIQCFGQLSELQEEEVRAASRHSPALLKAMEEANDAIEKIPAAALASAAAESSMDSAHTLIRSMGDLAEVLLQALRAHKVHAVGANGCAEAEALVKEIFARFGEALGAFCQAAMDALTAIQAEMAAMAASPGNDAEEHTFRMVLEFSKMTSIEHDTSMMIQPRAAEFHSLGRPVDQLDTFIVHVLEFVAWGDKMVCALSS